MQGQSQKLQLMIANVMSNGTCTTQNTIMYKSNGAEICHNQVLSIFLTHTTFRSNTMVTLSRSLRLISQAEWLSKTQIFHLFTLKASLYSCFQIFLSGCHSLVQIFPVEYLILEYHLSHQGFLFLSVTVLMMAKIISDLCLLKCLGDYVQ